MKKLLSKFLIIALFLGAFSFISVQPAHAAASLYLSPSGATVSQGATFTVFIRVNTGGAKVNAIQANLSYPADKLDFLWVGTGGTAFEITAEGFGGGGVVKIGRGTISAKSGDLLVASVAFKAKLSSGSATVSFAGGSAVVTSGNNILSGKSGGTYSFKKAPPPPPKPKPDKTAPKISDIKITDLTRQSAKISWKTNENADSVVEWGPTEKYGITTSNTKLVKSHSLNLDKRLLTPGVSYHFRIQSKDKAGNIATSEDMSFKVPGFKVQIKVADEDGNPVVGVKVTLVSVGETTTDENGIATFEDAPAGEYAVLIEYDGKTASQVVNIEEKDETQTFETKIEGIAAKKQILQDQNTLVIVLGLIIIAALAAFIFKRRFFHYKKSKEP